MLAQTLRYPLQGHALPIVIVFALLFWVGSASLFGLVATAIAISWPMKYAYHVLERSARGHRDPPPMTIELVNPVSQQPLKHLFVLGVLFSLCYWVNALLGGWVSTPLLVAGLALQPAVAAVIALDDNLFAALEPRALTAIVRQLGVDYGLTAAWLVASAMIVFFAVPQLPRGIWYALLLYAVLSCFHLLGLALYRHRDQLGIDPDLSPEREAEALRTGRHRHLNRILDQAYALANGNRHKAAAETLISALAADGDRLDDHGYIHQQTRQWAAPQASLRHGQVYISRLWQAQRSAEAVEVYGHCQRLSDAFRLEDAAQVLPLARTAITINRSFLAAHMLRQFEQRFPNHPDCGAVVRLRGTLESD
jgi:hypothetical protein